MWNRAREVCALLSIATLAACAGHPPAVASASDVRRLPRDSEGVQAGALGDDQIDELARFPKLRYISFGPSWTGPEKEVTAQGLARLAALELPELRQINVGRGQKIDDAAVRALCNVKPMRWLLMYDCQGITDEALRELAEHSQLESLGLSGCDGITDEGLRALADLPTLTELYLSGCANVTMLGALQLAELPRLQKLYLDGCPQVNADQVHRLRALMPTVRIAHDDGVWSHDDWTRWQALLAEAWN